MAETFSEFSPAAAVGVAAASIPTHPYALLDEGQAAQVLNLSIRTLQAWRLRGGGPNFVRVSSRCVRYRNSSLAAFIEARTVTSTSDPGPGGNAAAGAPVEG